MTPPTLYDVFAPPRQSGGKRVAVFDDSQGDLQTRAAQASAPLSVFIDGVSAAALSLRVFTPTREKGESDSATLAALSHVEGQLADVVEVSTGQSSTTAQRCGDEWLLQQGIIQVEEVDVDLSPLQLEAPSVFIASTGRPNLIVEVKTLEMLDQFQPDAQAIERLNHSTATTGLVLYTLEAPGQGPQRHADVCFRAFGPLKGFLEDAASSNMLACLTGVLAHRQLLPSDTNLLRAAQRMPQQPALLSAQFTYASEAIWVGGRVRTDEK